jgi:type III restriction enzyme
MAHLYQELAKLVDEWRASDYKCESYPVISEILEWAANPEGPGFKLRKPQIRALETYWYLRLVEKTPHIFDLYRKLLSDDPEKLLDSLGISLDAFREAKFQLNKLWKLIRNDNDFVKKYKLEALRETLTLAYPSYILALAMGAGKTILIGAIIATEFAMALEYQDNDFVQNALVFAPGKTIIESLRELAETHYERIIPPRLYKSFAASVKLTFTRDGEKDIPVIRGSLFNIVVTNTEKIRIQKEAILKSALRLFNPNKEDEARSEVANLRLQAIASLPHLAVFSDEAHHTYGQALETELKKVRKTVDYLADNTNVVCVINTTGTPYYKRQPLRDVVIWYGLSEGIRDGILKQIAGNIRGYSFDGDVSAYLSEVIGDFFASYGEVTLPDGTPAKMAIYFPQTDDVEKYRPAIETKLAELGLSPTLLLEHHTRCENKNDFDRFKFKDSPHRVALLVDRGVEGWDVPALFSCALARKLKSSNNFVLQAASRCLRQVPDNEHSARIYLSMDNQNILDRQLQETYGETISDLNRAVTRHRQIKLRLRKLALPPLVVKQVIRTVVKKAAAASPLKLIRPKIEVADALTRTDFTVAEQKADYHVLQQTGETVEITSAPRVTGLYAVAVEFSAVYRVDFWPLLDELSRIYEDAAAIPTAHLAELSRQIEEQTRNYEIKEETIEKALALIKLEGFDKTPDDRGGEIYTTEITYPIDKEKLLTHWVNWQDKSGEFGFHYDPYDFDSSPEQNFFESLLEQLNLHPSKIEDIYFTGGITTPDKTDFFIEYKGSDDKTHRYTPDFVIRRKDGRCLIVEIKDARFQAATEEDLAREKRGEAAITVEGRKAVAVKRWQKLNSRRLKYEIIFAAGDTLGYNQLKSAREFVEEE